MRGFVQKRLAFGFVLGIVLAVSDIIVDNQARVAELADALDSGFHFWHFQGASSRFKESEKTLDFTGENALQPHQSQVSTKSLILSQLVSQFLLTILVC